MKINTDFVLRDIFGVHLLIPVRNNNISNEVIALNDTAAAIFTQCGVADTPENLAMGLSTQFTDISESEAYTVLLPYIKSLIEQGFLMN